MKNDKENFSKALSSALGVSRESKGFNEICDFFYKKYTHPIIENDIKISENISKELRQEIRFKNRKRIKSEDVINGLKDSMEKEKLRENLGLRVGNSITHAPETNLKGIKFVNEYFMKLNGRSLYINSYPEPITDSTIGHMREKLNLRAVTPKEIEDIKIMEDEYMRLMDEEKINKKRSKSEGKLIDNSIKQGIINQGKMVVKKVFR